MTWQDLVNGAYELGAGVAVLNHCRCLARDWEVKGVSVASTVFFTSWGYWNLYYYPHLDQWLSFLGGLAIVSANTLWLTMMALVLRPRLENLLFGGRVTDETFSPGPKPRWATWLGGIKLWRT